MTAAARTPLDVSLAAVESELYAAQTHHRRLPYGDKGSAERARYVASAHRIYALMKRRDDVRARLRAAFPTQRT